MNVNVQACGGINPHELANPLDLYSLWMNTDMNVASLSSVASPSEIQQWDRGWSSQGEKLKKIREYCEARIDDVVKVNKASHTLAAFTAIPVLIGFLANLAFGENSEFNQSSGGDKSDSLMYRVFVRRFILRLSAREAMLDALPVNKGGRGRKGLDWMLYKYVRCGLVHSASLVNERIDPGREITVKITHSDKVSQEAPEAIDTKMMQWQSGTKLTIALIALDFCEWVGKATSTMFKEAKNDADLACSIIEVFKKKTPVIKFEPI